MSEADEIVELIVPARERSCVARALLAAAERLGLPAEVVQSTSTGYRAPLAIAEAADEQLADKDREELQQVHAARTPGGRVTYQRDQAPDEVDDDGQADEPELPAAVRNRKRGGRS